MDPRYSDIFVGRAAQALPDPAPAMSSYFATPGEAYDERLLSEDGAHLRSDVRDWILGTLYSFLQAKGYRYPERWLKTWIAGSGITLQWVAHQGQVGDLDVLLGVNWPEFFRHHPDHRGTPSDQMAGTINQQMYDELWLDEWHGPQGEYSMPLEVTFYINDAGHDITVLKPYAAYNVTDDQWDVDPLELPRDWGEEHISQDWRTAVQREIDMLTQQAAEFNHALAEVESFPEGPRRMDAQRRVAIKADQLRIRWEEIRSDRRQAFGLGGGGFHDYQSFRWQALKQAGISKVLREAASQARAARAESELSIYGRELP